MAFLRSFASTVTAVLSLSAIVANASPTPHSSHVVDLEQRDQNGTLGASDFSPQDLYTRQSYGFQNSVYFTNWCVAFP
jgi:hypothetical protein